MHSYDLVIYGDGRGELSLEVLASSAGLHPTVVQRFVELALLEPVDRSSATPRFELSALARLRLICRLRRTLGLNCAGVGVVLELLDKITRLEHEKEALKQRAF